MSHGTPDEDLDDGNLGDYVPSQDDPGDGDNFLDYGTPARDEDVEEYRDPMSARDLEGTGRGGRGGGSGRGPGGAGARPMGPSRGSAAIVGRRPRRGFRFVRGSGGVIYEEPIVVYRSYDERVIDGDVVELPPEGNSVTDPDAASLGQLASRELIECLRAVPRGSPPELRALSARQRARGVSAIVVIMSDGRKVVHR